MARGQHLDFQHIARLRAFDPNGAGERVYTSAVDGEELRCIHARLHLCTAGVNAFNLHFVARADAQAGLERAVPNRVNRLGGKRAFHQDPFTLTVI